MKVTQWWKLPSVESYLAMKVIYWWKLFSDESYLVIKVRIVNEVKRSDGLWRFACGDVCYCYWYPVTTPVPPEKLVSKSSSAQTIFAPTLHQHLNSIFRQKFFFQCFPQYLYQIFEQKFLYQYLQHRQCSWAESSSPPKKIDWNHQYNHHDWKR